MKFDNTQEHSGFNKYVHYQFGRKTCPFCKSDDAERVIVWNKGSDHKLMECTACTGRFTLDS